MTNLPRAPRIETAWPAGVVLAFLVSALFAPGRCRLLLPATAASGLAVLLSACAVLGETLTDMRLFPLLGTYGTHLSGRELLWSPSEQATAQASWLGRGLGTGHFIGPLDSEWARTLQTWTADNEYLRIEVAGGRIGCALLIGSLTLWVLWHTRALPRDERRIRRLTFLTLAAHAATDNVLISPPARVFFSGVAAVFANARAAPTGLPNTTALA
jgi:hypothetical protein